MNPLRVGLASVLCVSCFNPSGKGEDESSGSGGATTGSGTTGPSGPTTELPTTTTGASDTVASTTGGETTGTSGEVGPTTTVEGSSGSEGSSTGAMAVCGNGKVEPGELCDDGNQIEDDGCLANCTMLCSNGKIDGDEACDDGNVKAGDGCSDQCERDAAYVFVSSGTYPAIMLAGTGADEICQDLADNAMLPGTYRAWLSDGSMSAKQRITAIDWPYVRTDGAVVAKSFDVFLKGGMGMVLEVPIAVTEAKAAIQAQPGCEAANLVWTGTDGQGGLIADQNCVDWSSGDMMKMGAAGDLDENTIAWTFGCGLPCDQPAHLYCFEVPA